MAKQDVKEKEDEIREMIESFCAEHLNAEYAQLSKKLLQKLARKRDVPFKRGKSEVWAAAIIYAIGSINFLSDKSFEPYLPLSDISKLFGVSNSTVSNKARETRKMFRLDHFDQEFSTDEMHNSNPLNDMVMVDGFIVPISVLPDDLQDMVRKARAEGKDVEFTTK